MADNSYDTAPVRRRLSRPVHVVAAFLATLGIALLASACGGSSPAAGVANVGTTGTTGTSTSDTSATADPAAFASCMRAHGVADFPDPDKKGRIKVTGSVSKSGQRTGFDPNGPAWQNAMKSCKKFAPNGGAPDPKAQAKAIAQMLAFASCMRTHGVPKFPDPQVRSGGGITMMMKAGDGLDPSSPTFQAAQSTCQKLQPDGPKMQAGAGPSDGAGGGNVIVGGGKSGAP
jgi:hypothetical protein